MRTTKWLLVAPLALACGAAHALGLGQIQVKSKPGEPFLAEIPVVTSQPDELYGLRAQLASPDTFARVGLSPPQGLVADLEFVVTQSSNGTPVIRVSTHAPVNTPSMVFLMEVNWGEGKIVREFSALVDTPTMMGAGMPVIEDVAAAPSNLIDRSSQIVDEPVAAPDPLNENGELTDTVPQEVPGDEPSASEQRLDNEEVSSVAPEPTPPVSVRSAPSYVPTPPPAPGDTVARVERGQTLAKIAGQVRPEGRSLNETMVALLQANPKAFINGNINLVKTGAILRMPSDSDWNSNEVAQANRLVREHVARWRELQAVLSPVVADTPASNMEGDSAQTMPANIKPAQTDVPAGARLEIVPAADGPVNPKSVDSGTSSQGQGKTLDGVEDEEARVREELITRELELEELRSRLAELEAIQKDQERLLAMKNNELALAQKQLAERQAKAESTSITEAVAAVPPTAWGVGSLLAALLGLLGWRSARKRKQAREQMRAKFLADVQESPAQDMAAEHSDEPGVAPEEQSPGQASDGVEDRP